MKKLSVLILVLSLILISGSAFADSHENMVKEGTWILGADIDLGGTMTWGSGDYEIDMGFTINGEYVIPYKDNLGIGGGFAYQLPRSPEISSAAEFNFIPLYGIFKYDMEEGAYVVGHLGYNMLNGNEEFKNINAEIGGGLYYAAGFGIGMEKYNGEIIYSVNNGTWEDSASKYDLKYSKLSLSFGYEF